MITHSARRRVLKARINGMERRLEQLECSDWNWPSTRTRAEIWHLENELAKAKQNLAAVILGINFRKTKKTVAHSSN
jgi:hypothetical protein